MSCQICLRENTAEANYCADCGNALRGQAKSGARAITGVSSPRETLCASCGQIVAPNSRFCIQCGGSAGHSARADYGNIWLIALLIVGIVLCATAIVILNAFSKH
jgi:hypothetical protein